MSIFFWVEKYGLNEDLHTTKKCVDFIIYLFGWKFDILRFTIKWKANKSNLVLQFNCIERIFEAFSMPTTRAYKCC